MMYSRFSNKGEDSAFQIPEHYSGCAFAPSTRTQPQISPKHPPAFLEVAKPSIPQNPPPREEAPPPPPQKEEPQEIPEPAPPPSPPPHKEMFKPLSPSPLSSLFGNMGNAFPFSHGIGFEELLILGLILLLSRNDGDSDAVLLLGLLLFCG